MVIYFKGRLLSKFYYPFSLNESNFVDRFRTRMGILKGVGYVKVECKKFGILHLLNVHTFHHVISCKIDSDRGNHSLSL